MTSKDIKIAIDKMSDFQKWQAVNGENFSLLGYLFGTANLEIAIAFTKLFWPDFIEHDGGIFLQQAFSIEIYEQWQTQLAGNIQAIEQVMNHQHIDDMLPGADTIDPENLWYLGQTISQMWESRLKLLYPERDFEVNCDRDEDTVIVIFYQNPASVALLADEVKVSEGEVAAKFVEHAQPPIEDITPRSGKRSKRTYNSKSPL